MPTPEERKHPEDQGLEPDGPETGLKFFLAIFQSGIREARIYRAYPDEEGISFVYAGPAVVIIDVELRAAAAPRTGKSKRPRRSRAAWSRREARPCSAWRC